MAVGSVQVSRRARPALGGPASVFLLALLVEAVFVALLPARWGENQNTDYQRYYAPVAERILQGRGITINDDPVAARYPPGYSIILAPLFWLADAGGWPRESVVLGFNVLVGAASSVLVQLTARACFGQRVGWIAALLWSTYPFNLWLVKQPNSEVPFTFLLLLAVLLFVRALRSAAPTAASLFLVGVAIGVAALIRPMALALALPFVVVWLVRRELPPAGRALGVLALLLGNLLAVLPWEGLVWARTGQVVPLSTGGPVSMLDGLTIGVRSSAAGGEVHPFPEDVRALMRRVIDRCGVDDDTPCSVGEVVGLLGGELVAAPKAVLQLLLVKAARAWYGTWAGWFEPIIALVQAPYLLLALIGASLAGRSRQRRFVLLVVLITLYFWAMTIAVLSILRYMTPAMGLLMILAALPPARAARLRGG